MSNAERRPEDIDIDRDLTRSGHELYMHIRSRHPVIYCLTHEEKRVRDDLDTICVKDEKAFYKRDCVEGLLLNGKKVPFNSNDGADIHDPMTVLEWIVAHLDEETNPQGQSFKGQIFLVCDFHQFLKEPNDWRIERQLRLITMELKNVRTNIVISGPDLHIPSTLDKCITVLDYELPNQDEMEEHVDELLDGISENDNFKDMEMNDEKKESVVKAALGLTFEEDGLRARAELMLRTEEEF